MKEKPLRKSARFISILLSIGCIIFGIMSVLLFAGIMVFVCAKLFFSEIFLEAWETAIKAGQTLSFGQCIILFHLRSWRVYLYLLALYNGQKNIWVYQQRTFSFYKHNSYSDTQNSTVCSIICCIFRTLCI